MSICNINTIYVIKYFAYFNYGAFFNFDGLDLPGEVKEEAYKKILQDVEDNPESE